MRPTGIRWETKTGTQKETRWGLHLGWNATVGCIWGLPVSGLDLPSFLDTRTSGAELWYGGAFGPEAGLIGVGAMVLGALLIVLWLRWQDGRVQLCTDLAVYTPHSRPETDSETERPQVGIDINTDDAGGYIETSPK